MSKLTVPPSTAWIRARAGVSGPDGARKKGAAARPATAARAGTEATRDVRDDDAAIELGLARVAQTASRNDGRGAGAVADALGAAQQVSKGHAVPSAERWPDAVWLPVDGRATPVRLERVDGPLATVLGPRGRVVVAREELTALEPRRERVAHARVDADGKVDLGTGLKVGVATRDRAPYDVVFDHALGRFVAAPSGHYRPVVHGQTAASRALGPSDAALTLLARLKPLEAQRYARAVSAARTPEAKLLLERVFVASGGDVAEVTRFHARLGAALGALVDDPRAVLRLGTADGVQDLLGHGCALTTLEYQRANLDPREALRLVELGADGLRREQAAAQAAVSGATGRGVAIEQAVAALDAALGAAVGDRFVAVTQAAASRARGSAMLRLVAAHVGGRPPLAPEGVQLYLDRDAALGHAVLVTGVRVERDLYGREAALFTIRDPSTARSVELAADVLLDRGVLGLAARASVLDAHGARLGLAPARAAGDGLGRRVGADAWLEAFIEKGWPGQKTKPSASAALKALEAHLDELEALEVVPAAQDELLGWAQAQRADGKLGEASHSGQLARWRAQLPVDVRRMADGRIAGASDPPAWVTHKGRNFANADHFPDALKSIETRARLGIWDARSRWAEDALGQAIEVGEDTRLDDAPGKKPIFELVDGERYAASTHSAKDWLKRLLDAKQACLETRVGDLRKVVHKLVPNAGGREGLASAATKKALSAKLGEDAKALQALVAEAHLSVKQHWEATEAIHRRLPLPPPAITAPGESLSEVLAAGVARVITGSDPQPVTKKSAKALAAEAAAEAAEAKQRAAELTSDDQVLRLTNTSLDDLWTAANARLAEDPRQAYGDILDAVFEAQRGARTKAMAAARKKFVAAGVGPAWLEALDAWWSDATFRAEYARFAPDLSFGERVPRPEVTVYAASGDTPAERAERQQLVERLAKVKAPAGEADKALLVQLLDTLALPMLRALSAAGYAITVARDTITSAERDLAGKSASGTPIDLAEGLHRVQPGERPRITVRSYIADGSLRLDASTLLHEISHAVDLKLPLSAKRGVLPVVAAASARGVGAFSSSQRVDVDALHELPELIEAFKAEHTQLPPYFHDQVEFVAEVLARYFLDRGRLARELPKTAAALDKLGLAEWAPAADRLARFQTEQVPPVVSNPKGDDPLETVRGLEQVNRVRRSQKLAPMSYVLEVVGDASRGASELVRGLAETLRATRSPGAVRYRNDEALIRMTGADFADAAKVTAALDAAVAAGHGTLIEVSQLGTIDAKAAGFKVLEQYQKRLGGVAQLALVGTNDELARLRDALPSVQRVPVELGNLTGEQVFTLAQRQAAQEGYVLTDEARKAFADRTSSGTLDSAAQLWREVKTQQTKRLSVNVDNLELAPDAVHVIVEQDVRKAQVAKGKDPLAALDAMIGQKGPKAEVRKILAAAKLAAAQAQHGVGGKRQRLNLLFTGNPGTGKTTFANHLVDKLVEDGILKSKTIVRPTVADIKDGNPEANVKKLFEKAKDGAIFFDELHQLFDTEEGRRAMKAMVPYLANKEYEGTAFIGAGYTKKVRELLGIDEGLEGRFREVAFEDYGTDELAQLLDHVIRDRDRTVSPETRDAALLALERERKRMRSFGNARTVEAIVDRAIGKQNLRLESGEVELDATSLRALEPEDFAPEAVISKADVWKQIDALDGLANIKAELRKIADAIELAHELGEDPLKSFEPYIFLQGPPGTGKTTLARILARFFAAYGIVPTAEIEEVSGAKMQGQFVGQTAPHVAKVFDRAWGGTLFLDEAAGLARAGGSFKEDATKEIVATLENSRGKFIFIAADYPSGREAFFGLDDGISSRFGRVWTFEPMSAAQATKNVKRRLEEELGLALPAGEVPTIEKVFAQLVKLPSYASGRDARTLANAIKEAQATAYLARKAAGEKGVDPKQALPEAVKLACDQLLARKKEEAKAKPKGEAEDVAYDVAVQAKVATAAKSADEVIQVSAEERAIFDAISKADVKFADVYVDDPDALEAAKANPKSAYVKAVAAAMGVEPAEAVEAITKVAEKTKKFAKMKVVKQRFEYHCPFCGGIDSASCAYINRPIEWKIQHSLKKPWNVVEEKTIELE